MKKCVCRVCGYVYEGETPPRSSVPSVRRSAVLNSQEQTDEHKFCL